MIFWCVVVVCMLLPFFRIGGLHAQKNSSLRGRRLLLFSVEQIIVAGIKHFHRLNQYTLQNNILNN